MFEAPGKPVSRAVHHKIDLIDPIAPTSYLYLYRMSEDKLVAIKWSTSDSVENGWFRLSFNIFRALLTII